MILITRINNKNKKISEKIYLLFQASYKVEAELLSATDFPPLNRTTNEFVNCDNVFYSYYLEKDLAGVIEVDHNNNATHIQSLVVHPRYFRKGIGKKLVQFILDSYVSRLFTVETGLENQPAINLYTGIGFKEAEQWDTDHNVRKIRFEIERRNR